VVPNFVIQSGCPRGDGFGSLGFTIRSEVGDTYYNDEGYVGMASAGLHTEGTQFFITHSPTPHLDGRYTIFAKVIEGMDVVHKISIGDTIKTINIIY
jgi:cyclophilin family peptidyl-prolyl cis-trans isomerase